MVLKEVSVLLPALSSIDFSLNLANLNTKTMSYLVEVLLRPEFKSFNRFGSQVFVLFDMNQSTKQTIHLAPIWALYPWQITCNLPNQVRCFVIPHASACLAGRNTALRWSRLNTEGSSFNYSVRVAALLLV